VKSSISSLLYVLFAAVVSAACYLRPAQGDFDRYMYEAVARSRTENWESIYPIVKHENPRAEASVILDSPEHMAQLEPVYAIRPVYVSAITLVRGSGLDYQRTITLISSLALFGIALVLLRWTRRPFYSALLLMSPAVLDLGRQGTPDALNALLILAALFMLAIREQMLPGLVLLMLSLWVRTDSVLVVFAVLGWLLYRKKLPLTHVLTVAGLAVLSVAVINHFSGNYGYRVLFRESFLEGKYPALIEPRLSLRDYLIPFVHNLPTIIPQIALWVLLGLVAWRLHSPKREWIVPVGIAAAAHFALFPSGELRYFAPWYLLAGVLFVSGIPKRVGSKSLEERSPCPQQSPLKP